MFSSITNILLPTRCTSIKLNIINIEESFSNVSIGEVWLAGGQSNMEFELQNCTEGPDEIQNQKHDPNVRFYYTNKIAWKDEHFFEAEKNTCWQTWESEGIIPSGLQIFVCL